MVLAASVLAGGCARENETDTLAEPLTQAPEAGASVEHGGRAETDAGAESGARKEEDSTEEAEGDTSAQKGSEDEQPGAFPEQDATASETFEAFRSDKIFISDLPEEALPRPEEEIASDEDMLYALDYLAFYRVGDEVFFRISPDFAEEIYNPYPVFRQAYREADLADVYACQLNDSYYSDYGVVGIKYSMSRNIATEAPEVLPETPVLPSFDYASPAEGRDAASSAGDKAQFAVNELIFATDDAAKEPIPCENGEQLYYLAAHGLRPVPVPGSMAEELYEDAKTVLRGLIAEEMSDFLKIKAVYDWLTTEVRYDAETAYTSETYLVKEQAYYLEGVFLNRCAVCDGKAKAAALLLNMLGIPCVRTTGVNEGGDHAWNMVCLEGKWYVFCSTYGQANLSEDLGFLVPNYSMLLAGADTPYEWYPADKHRDIEALLEPEPYDIFGVMGEAAGVSLKVEDAAGLDALLTAVGEYGKVCKAEFEYVGEDAEGFQEVLISRIRDLEGVNAAAVRNADTAEPAFQIYFTGEG